MTEFKKPQVGYKIVVEFYDNKEKKSKTKELFFGLKSNMLDKIQYGTVSMDPFTKRIHIETTSTNDTNKVLVLVNQNKEGKTFLNLIKKIEFYNSIQK